MYLKAIELHGFKSFPDKTKIEFEKGMSVVVGPNGSGKSNISDAIRWVLGETRGSQLRAGAKMEDIIFGGTQKRAPMGFASVSLILDNSDRDFDVDSDEIAVMRKYYRGGDSEYYINGARVRLKDIQELFFDTGLGKNGYSIVSQGKVSEIVTARPEGRREIFEEACGIAKYRYRKNEAERKLENARGNITRLSDILSTLEERVGPLEKESRKAKEFLSLSEKKKELEISLWLDTVDKSKELIRRQQRRLEIFSSDYEQVSQSLEESEKYLEERYLYANSLLAKGEENTRAMRRAEADISSMSAEKAAAQSRAGFAKDQIESLRRELSGFENEQSRFDSRSRRLKEKIRQLKEQQQAKEQQRTQWQSSLEEIAAKAQSSGDKKGRISAQINSLQLEDQRNKIDIATAQSRNVSLNRAVENARKSAAVRKEYCRQSQNQEKQIQEFIAAADESIEKNNNIKKGLLMKRASLQEKADAARKAAEENLSNQQRSLDRIRILQDLENNMDGFAQSVKAVLKKGREGSLGGILGSVAQIISVEKGYETAVEIALGYALQNIVVENEGAAKQAMAFLKNNRAGRATFLPLDTVRPSNFNENLPRWARTADTVIKARDRYKNIVSNLLGRTVIVDDIDSASSLAKKLSYRYRIVTLDGQQINAGGSFTGGSLNKSAGLFTRKSEIEQLKQNVVQLKEHRVELEKNVRSTLDALAAVDSRIEGCDSETAQLNSDKARAQIECARLQQMISRYGENIRRLQADIDRSLAQIKENEDRQAALYGRQEANRMQLQQLQSRLEKLGRQDEESTKQRAHLTQLISGARLDIVQIKGQITLEENNLRRLCRTLENRQARRDKINRDIQVLEQSLQEKLRFAAATDEKIEAKRQFIAQKEEENRSFVAQRLEVEAERTRINTDNKDLLSKKEELSGQIAKTGERISAMETAYDEIIAKLWEEYELTVQTARAFCVRITDEALMKKDLASVKNAIKRLGSVNVGAIEEYKEVSRRYEYLKGQLEDLQESRNRLIKLIASLNSEMISLFSRSFEIINDNFGRIFAELFGGGSARLELVDKEDVLSSGIEISVNPPGKVIKSLTALSGGEQAMVALAIYFAILAHNPSPFCVLDEIEAALDDVNVTRYANYLHRICDRTQFIVITHRRGTMEAADVIYGVTMQEDGISKLLKLDVNNLSPSILN